MVRKDKVMSIMEWYESGDGKKIINEMLPYVQQNVSQNYKIPQFLNRNDVAGVYKFYFKKGNRVSAAYIGEAGNVYFRLLEHLYNLFNKITNWGVSPDEFSAGNMQLIWECKIGISDKVKREKCETEEIEKEKPFLQYTAIDSNEYGQDKVLYDKLQKRKLHRDEIRTDICVIKPLRKKRAEELFII